MCPAAIWSTVVVRAVVDGQGDIDGGDLDIAHDAGAADVQEAVIFRLLALGQEIAGLARGLQHGVVGVVRQALHVLRAAGDGAGGVQRVPVVADARIQKQGQPCGEQQNEQHGRAMFFHLQDSPFLCFERPGAGAGDRPLQNYRKDIITRSCSSAAS